MEFLEELPTSSLVRVFVFSAITLMLSYMWLNRRSSESLNLPPSVSVLKAAWSCYRSGIPLYEYARQLRKTHGDIYRINAFGHLVILMNDFDSIKEALNNPHISDRPNADANAIGQSGILLANGDLWQQQRRFTLGIFRRFGIGKSKFEYQIEDESRAFIEEVALLKGEYFDPTHLLQNAVANVICAIVFGKRFEYSDEKFKYWLQLSTLQVKLSVRNLPIVFLPSLRYFPRGARAVQTIVNNFLKLAEFAGESIANHKRERDPDHPRDLIDSYLQEISLNQESSDGKFSKLTEDTLTATIVNLFAAGTDTTALTMRWAILYMAIYTDVQEGVHKEMDAVVGHNRFPKLADKPFLKYTQAVLLEVQRMASTSRFGVFHSCSKTTTVRGMTIPQGAVVVPNLWAVHRDTDVWSEPFKFKPERFLDENGDLVIREELIPFSIGRRICLGENLARMELFIFFTQFMHQFRLESTYEGTSMSIADQGRNPKDYQIRAIARE